LAIRTDFSAARVADIDDIGALGAAHADTPAQLVQRFERMIRIVRREGNPDGIQGGAEHVAETRAHARELGIAVEMLGGDDPAQHAVRSQHAHLAFHLDDVGIRELDVAGERLVDRVQLGRIDQDLGDGGILRRRQKNKGRHREQRGAGHQRNEPGLPPHDRGQD
jgi:hypothetical protein